MVVMAQTVFVCVKIGTQDPTAIFPLKLTEDIFVGDLKKIVHAEMGPELEHIAAVRLQVTKGPILFFFEIFLLKCWFLVFLMG
jgi:hypothetical protein